MFQRADRYQKEEKGVKVYLTAMANKSKHDAVASLIE